MADRHGWSGIVGSKSDAMMGKTSAAARPVGSADTGRHSWPLCLWHAQNVLTSQHLTMKSDDLNKQRDGLARRRQAAHSRTGIVLSPRVKRSPMST